MDPRNSWHDGHLACPQKEKAGEVGWRSPVISQYTYSETGSLPLAGRREERRDGRKPPYLGRGREDVEKVALQIDRILTEDQQAQLSRKLHRLIRDIQELVGKDNKKHVGVRSKKGVYAEDVSYTWKSGEWIAVKSKAFFWTFFTDPVFYKILLTILGILIMGELLVILWASWAIFTFD